MIDSTTLVPVMILGAVVLVVGVLLVVLTRRRD